MSTQNIRVRIDGYKYHRNGISGEGFHVAEFTALSGDVQGRKFVAVIYPSTDVQGYETERLNGKCSVLSLHCDTGRPEIQETWRGDNFEASLRKLIWMREQAEIAKTCIGAADVEVSTSYYASAHGKAPRGRGQWAFCPREYHHRSDYLRFVHFVAGMYSDAKRAAQEHFAAQGVNEIVVCS